MAASLSARGIATGSICWPPCHLEPYYLGRAGDFPARCPLAEDVLGRTLTLPLHAGMSLEDVDRVCDSVVRALS